MSLLCTLLGLLPRSWEVDVTLLRQDPLKLDQGLGLEDFFSSSARYKRRWLFCACLLFFAGILFAIVA